MEIGASGEDFLHCVTEEDSLKSMRQEPAGQVDFLKSALEQDSSEPAKDLEGDGCEGPSYWNPDPDGQGLGQGHSGLSTVRTPQNKFIRFSLLKPILHVRFV